MGVSFDYLTGAAAAVPHETLNQFNPKFGITWNPFLSTSIRAAAFRVIKRTLITDQTLEPTQVAGFNQFFDDIDVTNAWSYGAAVDQKISQNVFVGAQFSLRDLKVPGINPTVSPPAILKFKVKEYLSHAYLFWTPHPWFALRGTYEFERFNNNPLVGIGGTLDTHRVPLGMNFFHPSGLGVFLAATYYNQSGKIASFTTGSLESGSDNFGIVDAALNYRLPRRYGFITIGATNLTNQKFKFFDTDTNNPRIQPKRTFFLKLTLAFP
jgi:hypothetical protein